MTVMKWKYIVRLFDFDLKSLLRQCHSSLKTFFFKQHQGFWGCEVVLLKDSGGKGHLICDNKNNIVWEVSLPGELNEKTGKTSIKRNDPERGLTGMRLVSGQ